MLLVLANASHKQLLKSFKVGVWSDAMRSATSELEKSTGTECVKLIELKKWTHQKKLHITSSKFTEFGDVWLDNDHVVSFQKSDK